MGEVELMKFIRDVRDDPEPPKPWREQRFQFTKWICLLLFGQIAVRIVANDSPDGIAKPLAVGLILCLIWLPFALLVDCFRLLKARRAGSATRVIPPVPWPPEPSSYRANNGSLPPDIEGHLG